jgi:hypothetical protein
MDLRSALLGLRLVYDGYLLAVFTTLTVIDLVVTS